MKLKSFKSFVTKPAIFESPVQTLKLRKSLYQASHDSLSERNFLEIVRKQFPDFKELSFYVGFDPTANSLHLGNLMAIVASIRLSLIGLTPIFLIGGATG